MRLPRARCSWFRPEATQTPLLLALTRLGWHCECCDRKATTRSTGALVTVATLCVACSSVWNRLP